MEGGTLNEAVKGHDFKESQVAFVAKEVPIRYLIDVEERYGRRMYLLWYILIQSIGIEGPQILA